MGTPNSSQTSYISVSEFLNFRDWRPVAQLSVDDGTQPSEGSLQTNQNLLKILESASGEVEAVLVAGGRYSATDLQTLDGVSKKFLQQIVADIAMFNLYCRRAGNGPPETVVDAKDRAYVKLDQLNKGDLVLSFTENIEAGVPVNEFMTQVSLKNLNLFSDSCSRALGVRNAFRRGF